MGTRWRELRTTLPGHDYRSPEIYELDRERVFFREWMYVARADEAPEPGDFVTVDVAGESVVVVRGKDEQLRGFYNVCRHRGSRICDAETRGHAKGAIKCPYHAWTYSYEGKLIGTPLVAKDELDRSTLGLWPVRLEEWQGYVFVNLTADAPSLRESLEEAIRQAAAIRELEHARAPHGPSHRQRGRLELEDPDRELQRVPALPDRPSRALAGRARIRQGARARDRAGTTGASRS